MWICITLAVVLGIIAKVDGQKPRLRQALQGTDWLNDVDGDNIPGQAGLDYPVHASVPAGTSFRCSDYDYAGYFGDVEADCQAYHVCFPDGRNASFLCVNGTVFHQRYFVCDWWFHFNCSHAPSLYDLNLFRKIPLPVLPPVQRRPFPGPIPQPKAELIPLQPRSPQPRGPKKLGTDPNENDKMNRNKEKQDTSKPLNEYPSPDNKWKNPQNTRRLTPENELKTSLERGKEKPGNKWNNPLNKDKGDERCECQCNSNPSKSVISPYVQYV